MSSKSEMSKKRKKLVCVLKHWRISIKVEKWFIKNKMGVLWGLSISSAFNGVETKGVELCNSPRSTEDTQWIYTFYQKVSQVLGSIIPKATVSSWASGAGCFNGKGASCTLECTGLDCTWDWIRTGGWVTTQRGRAIERRFIADYSPQEKGSRRATQHQGWVRRQQEAQDHCTVSTGRNGQSGAGRLSEFRIGGFE